MNPMNQIEAARNYVLDRRLQETIEAERMARNSRLYRVAKPIQLGNLDGPVNSRIPAPTEWDPDDFVGTNVSYKLTNTVVEP
jgi:hypothetical protein